MSHRALYKSKSKALTRLIFPAVMSGMLAVLFLDNDRLFDYPIVWLWVAVIGVTATMAFRDLIRTKPHFVLDEAGLNDGRFLPWHAIEKISLAERRYGPKRSQYLIVELVNGANVNVEVSDLQVSPGESFDLTRRFWISNRDRISSAVRRSQSITASIPAGTRTTIRRTCPGCGAPTDKDDWECSRCYERLG